MNELQKAENSIFANEDCDIDLEVLNVLFIISTNQII